jgi:hypothetical protein
MSVRSLNGLNSSVRSLNGLSTQLKDGKAIKVSNKNEIDVNMKTNTTEQTTIGDTDLFLLSDTTGANIKHITGINLKQKALLHLVGGTNINLTNDSSNDTVINLDDEIELQKVSLTKNPKSTTYPLNFEFYVADNNEFRLIAQGSASTGPTAPPYEQILMGVSTETIYPFKGIFDFYNGFIRRVLTINTFNSNVLTVNNNNQQFLIKDTNKNFTDGKFVSVDSSAKLTPMDILATDNITKTINSADITLKLNDVISGLTSINGYTFDLATTTARNQFLLKQDGVGAFSSGDLLNINSTGKVNNITPTQLLNTLTVSNGLTKNTNDISISLTPTISITETMTLSGATNSLLKIKSVSNSFQPKLQYFQGDNLRVFQQYDYGNSKFDFAVKTGALHLKSYVDTTNTQVILDNEIVNVKVGNSSNSAIDILTCSFTTVDIYKELDTNGNQITFKTNDNFQYIKFLNDTSLNGLEIVGYGEGSTKASHRFKAGQNTTNILEIYPDKIDVNKKVLWFDNENEKGYIRFDNTMFEIQSSGCDLRLGKRGGSGSSNDIVIDTSSITFNKRLCFTSSTNDDRYIVLQGNDITSDSRIIGYSNRIDIIGKETSSTNPAIRFLSASTTVFQIHQDRTNMYKPLYMNSTASLDRPIYLHHNEAFFVKYKFANSTGDKINGTDLGGYGGSDGTDFASVRITATDNNYAGTLAEFFPKNIKMYKHAGVILDNNTNFPLSENDAFTIRKDGLCNLLIRSFSNSAKIKLQASNNYGASIEFTGSQFRIETVNQELKTVASNHNFYNSSTLRLAFQSDTNLVVYNGSTVKFASNDSQNAHSSRDYKKNINDLVESESINVIRNINPVSFEYLEQYWDEHDRCNACNCDLRKGFIWEDTQPILPQATRTINMNNPDEPTTKTLDLKMVIPDLTKTVQYLLNEISTLKEQLLTQSNLISNLQSQINSL